MIPYALMQWIVGLLNERVQSFIRINLEKQAHLLPYSAIEGAKLLKVYTTTRV
jgi:hypothetical protein